MQKLLIEANPEIARYFENECVVKGLTFAQLFEKMVETYKEELNGGRNPQILPQEEEKSGDGIDDTQKSDPSPEVRRRGRPRLY